MREWIARAMLGAALIVSGCSPIYQTVYDYTPPPTTQGLLCSSQCNEISNLCRQNCRLREDRCEAQARERGAYDYERYVHNQEADNLPIEKSISDFTHYYGCSSARSCQEDCVTPYNQCFTTCGGLVSSRQICTAFCN